MVVAWAPLEANGVLVCVVRLSGAGGLPSMKWMKTNGPATTRAMMAAAPPINPRFHCRRVAMRDMIDDLS